MAVGGHELGMGRRQEVGMGERSWNARKALRVIGEEFHQVPSLATQHHVAVAVLRRGEGVQQLIRVEEEVELIAARGQHVGSGDGVETAERSRILVFVREMAWMGCATVTTQFSKRCWGRGGKNSLMKRINVERRCMIFLYESRFRKAQVPMTWGSQGSWMRKMGKMIVLSRCLGHPSKK
jgi:hypothetical protein